MLIAPFAALLKERIGLDVETIGEAGIERAVRERLRICKLHDPQLYWQQLEASAAEMQELIEAVVVPETWFFRDREAFTGLTSFALREWLPAHSEGVLRVLSLPCATGEEPYSMAMALLDAGFPEHRLRIEAVDISLRVIARAERARYGKNSFRGADLGFRGRHFVRDERHYRLNENVRRQVSFRQANLFASNAFPDAHVYDVIFCRNVLIYFDRHGQKLAIRLISRLLTQAGILFVGPSESTLPMQQGFVTAGVSATFAFRRDSGRAPSGGESKTRPARLPIALSATPRPSPVFNFVRQLRSAVAPAPRNAPPEATALAPAPSSESWLEVARRLADVGELSQAMELCDRNLVETAPTAAAFYLKGLLHDALGQSPRANENYRKALYLDPGYQEALVHLAAALRRDGDLSGAERLFERAKRARRGGR
jgi:chemotaxis protein methyltransferase WspC